MSIQQLLPASHVGQRIARHVAVALLAVIVVLSTLSITLTAMVTP